MHFGTGKKSRRVMTCRYYMTRHKINPHVYNAHAATDHRAALAHVRHSLIGVIGQVSFTYTAGTCP